MDIRDILSEYGYGPFLNDGKYWRCAAVYRNGANQTSLRINKETGHFSDFNGDSGNLSKLISITTGEKEYQIIERLKSGGLVLEKQYKEPMIVKYFPDSSTDRLFKIYDFYTNKEFPISEKTLETFKGGVAMKDKMYNRFVFPIWDEKGRIVAFAGRDLSGQSPIKWKYIGKKMPSCHPYHLSEEYIKKEGCVILVESVGDLLALWDAGVRNVLTLNGVKLTKTLRRIVMSLNNNICISLNNEVDRTDGGGAVNARQIRENLLAVKDKEKVKIIFPTKNDFGEMSKEEILEWKKEKLNFRHEYES